MKPPTEKKAYCFSLNASDWLASPSVKLMSKAERGVYIMLLCTAWESKATLPASEDKVRRLADMSPEEWATSGEVLLEKFPLSECGTYRFNPRLMSEYEKQEENRKTASLAGQKSAEKRAAEKAAKEAEELALQRKGNGNPTDLEINPTDLEEKPNGTPTLSKVKLSKESTDVDVAAAGEPLPAKTTPAQRVAQQVASDGGATFNADNWPGLNEPERFAAILKDLGYVGINAERYRLDIRATVRANDMDVPAGTLRKFIKSYLKRESDAGPLQPAPVVVAAPKVFPANPAELWGGINPNYDHRTHSQQPAGEYTGKIN